jgi:aryl-alcohol dehydrogenase-like predicted oxidoreductase
VNRRDLLQTALLGATAAGVANLSGCGRSSSTAMEIAPIPTARNGNMPLRSFGKTGLMVSEVGFGSWGIGGQSYGAVERQQALDALAKADELGCNFVDTAAVYGVSEDVLGEFLRDRRSRWIVASKYSGQPEGMAATLEKQLRHLQTEVIDFYQLHWMPRGKDTALFEELDGLKRAGKIRFAGVSLYNTKDIDEALANPVLDGFQVAFNLLEPDPFLARHEKIRQHGKAVIIRSALQEGFLTGKFHRDATFPDPNDQRHKMTREQIEHLVEQVERFRFLEKEAGSMVAAAARYPLSFPEVSTVILGTKSAAQAASNFGPVPGGRLSAESLRRIETLQNELGLRDRGPWWRRWFGLG